jgi:hypothetical protein
MDAAGEQRFTASPVARRPSPAFAGYIGWRLFWGHVPARS